jgi:hypothetical protein
VVSGGWLDDAAVPGGNPRDAALVRPAGAPRARGLYASVDGDVSVDAVCAKTWIGITADAVKTIMASSWAKIFFAIVVSSPLSFL